MALGIYCYGFRKHVVVPLDSGLYILYSTDGHAIVYNLICNSYNVKQITMQGTCGTDEVSENDSQVSQCHIKCDNRHFQNVGLAETLHAFQPYTSFPQHSLLVSITFHRVSVTASLMQ